ncbi:acyltransferase [uncultured Roseobacter sp.]|uniref:acyltransferase family protein n=1 Tax=uncultured Roseobacter sp. TaxID=114847 RepID=UPI00260A24E4|nr:acyltransferase [uncultured Roseobacter sp.]
MVAFPGVAPDALSRQIPIETMRGIAVIMLVSYHVVGPAAGTALDISYPHPLRLYADFFVDLRMPFFAFIAGYIYALRPVAPEQYSAFVAGKFRRLYLPGAVAMAAFALCAALLGNRFAVSITEVWQVFVFSYAHFWFLQAILVLFVCVGLVDCLTGHRSAPALLAASCVLYLTDFHFGTRFFSVDSAFYLLPFFLLGVVFLRHAAGIMRESGRLTIVLVVICGASALWNVRIYFETEMLSLARRDLQSLGFGLSACVLAMLWLPRVAWLERLSPYAFTIYLYHVFGTAGMRLLCDRLEINATEPRFVLGVMAGVLLPVLLHRLATRTPFPGHLVLGR